MTVNSKMRMHLESTVSVDALDDVVDSGSEHFLKRLRIHHGEDTGKMFEDLLLFFRANSLRRTGLSRGRRRSWESGASGTGTAVYIQLGHSRYVNSVNIQRLHGPLHQSDEDDRLLRLQILA